MFSYLLTYLLTLYDAKEQLINFYYRSASNLCGPFLPERDYVTFGLCYRKSVCRLQRWCTLLRRLNLSAIFIHRCTLAVVWPPCKILRRSSQGNRSIDGVKRKSGSKIE